MTTKENNRNSVDYAARIVGSRTKLGALFTPPVSRQAVDRWIKSGQVPPSRVTAISKLTGIPKGELNPCFKE